jgi:hypothetical protein
MGLCEFGNHLPLDRSGHDLASAAERGFSVKIRELFDGTFLKEWNNVSTDRLFAWELLNFFSLAF